MPLKNWHVVKREKEPTNQTVCNYVPIQLSRLNQSIQSNEIMDLQIFVDIQSAHDLNAGPKINRNYTYNILQRCFVSPAFVCSYLCVCVCVRSTKSI